MGFTTATYSAIQLQSPVFNQAVQLFTDSYVAVIPFAILLLAYETDSLFYRSVTWSTWRKPVFFLLGIGTAVLLSTWLKTVFDVARPCMVSPEIGIGGCETDMSFPSNHAATVFAMAPFFAESRKWFTVSAVYAVLVAASRVYLGQHRPLDVVSGAVLGFSIGYLFYLFASRESLVELYHNVRA